MEVEAKAEVEAEVGFAPVGTMEAEVGAQCDCGKGDNPREKGRG